MINFLLYTMLVLATAVANAFIDSYLIKKKWGKVKSLNHNSRTFIRICIFALGIVFIFGESGEIYNSLWEFLKSLFKPFLIGLYSFFLFNIVFDLLLNKLRNLPWYYDGKDAITDQISNELQDFFSVEDNSNEFIAKIELGIKILIILGLEIWIILI